MDGNSKGVVEEYNVHNDQNVATREIHNPPINLKNDALNSTVKFLKLEHKVAIQEKEIQILTQKSRKTKTRF